MERERERKRERELDEKGDEGVGMSAGVVE